MSDLKVHFATLENSHRAAQTLKSDFDDLPHRVGDGAHRGHHAVHDAMDPERYLGFLDLDPDHAERARSFPGGWRESTKMGRDAGGLLIMKRAQRQVGPAPSVYITGGGFAATGKRAAEVLGVIVRTRLYDAAGTRL